MAKIIELVSCRGWTLLSKLNAVIHLYHILILQKSLFTIWLELFRRCKGHGNFMKILKVNNHT